MVRGVKIVYGTSRERESARIGTVGPGYFGRLHPGFSPRIVGPDLPRIGCRFPRLVDGNGFSLPRIYAALGFCSCASSIGIHLMSWRGVTENSRLAR
jgi:hypothetical protein